MTEAVTARKLESVEQVASDVVVVQARNVVSVEVVSSDVAAVPSETVPGTAGAEPYGVVVEKTEVIVVSSGGQPGPIGPPGPQGVGGAATTLSLLNQTGFALRRGTPVVQLSDGTLAKAGAINNPKVIGLVYDETLPDSTYGVVQVDGILDALVGDWETATNETGGLVIGNYYLSTVDGRITKTPDLNYPVCIVGKAVSTTRFIIDIDRPVL